MNFFEKFGLLITVLIHLNCCSVAKTCDGHQFQCDDGECIAMIKVCNGRKDCSDESDEKKCNSEDYPRCNRNYFQCVSDRLCIPIEWRCDSEGDCDDDSDEDRCSASSCKNFEFACLGSERCIYVFRRCDGRYDCDDGSDEQYCQFADECLNGNIACDDGSQCIPLEWQCDGKKDCADGSDEKQCDNIPLASTTPATDLPATTDLSCPENYCEQNADCIVAQGQYLCNCSSSYTGEMCEIKIIDQVLVIFIAMTVFVMFTITALILFCCYKRRIARKSTALVSKSESQMPFTSYSKE